VSLSKRDAKEEEEEKGQFGFSLLLPHQSTSGERDQRLSQDNKDFGTQQYKYVSALTLSSAAIHK
jgi:hypothetical protein